MIRLVSTAALLALLAGCGDGQPFVFDEETEIDTPTEESETPTDGEGFDGDIEVPPGTTNPTPDTSIMRFEPEGDTGGGFVRSVSYNAAAQSFTVDNLAFDGVGPYQRNDSPDTLAGYAVFRSDQTVTDKVNGKDVHQLDYRAIYGVSSNRTTVDGKRLPVSRFAIVRSGDFTGYGFGGFLYERNGGVEMPTRRDGQAVFVGDYAGLRVFDGQGGQELTEAKMSIAVDFTDFNSSDGVDGVLYDRRAYTRDGADITVNRSGSRREDAEGTAVLDLPVARFTLTPGSVTDDGEILGTVSSRVTVDGKVTDYEDGTYYGIIGGDLDTGGEVVGVLVMTSSDPRHEGVTAQETGGFILYRDSSR